MPKIKTSRAAQKRFKKTRNGLFIRKKAFKGHLLEGKSTKRKRALSQKLRVSWGDSQCLRTMLPYL
jgi:large subunit ribosomal protein L35